jgi:hypothetical protein
MAGKRGAPIGNRNAAGSRGGVLKANRTVNRLNNEFDKYTMQHYSVNKMTKPIHSDETGKRLTTGHIKTYNRAMTTIGKDMDRKYGKLKIKK